MPNILSGVCLGVSAGGVLVVYGSAVQVQFIR